MKWMKAQSTASWPAIGGANRSHVPVILGPILEQQRQTATGPEAEQVAVLADYALGIQTAINLEGKQPFEYAGIWAQSEEEVTPTLEIPLRMQVGMKCVFCITIFYTFQ